MGSVIAKREIRERDLIVPLQLQKAEESIWCNCNREMLAMQNLIARTGMSSDAIVRQTLSKEFSGEEKPLQWRIKAAVQIYTNLP